MKTIGVVGMGYVGIPAAFLFAESPYYEKVYGFQRASKTSGYKIEMLNDGRNPLKGDEPGLSDLIRRVIKDKKFLCTDDFSKIGECDAVTISIQTPFKNKDDLIPDFSALFEGVEQVGKNIKKGALVVLESTVTPGTTVGEVKDILEYESGMKAGVDFYLAHAPERVMVGNLIRNIREYDRIVGGINKISTDRAAELYTPILTKGKIIKMSATAAEVTKTAENTFRDLQIAAANQLALYCEAMGINVYDVRNGIDSLKGAGVSREILMPGAGVGGHCLTKDTYHLERGVKITGALDYPANEESLFISARRLNDFMPVHMFNLTAAGLARAGKTINGSKIAILGWAFIANSDDDRNTPSEVYRDLVIGAGGDVSIHDPWVDSKYGAMIDHDMTRVIKDADAIVIMTGHSIYKNLTPEKISYEKGIVIVDGRNVIDPHEFIDKGFIYKGIGRGDVNNHEIMRK
ncbi:MAG: nucleotide sugar dehydrogenase [Tissierellia bacterium]|nr:nucleotide sugar dehydrogenase [Tissierellia bacterium]